MIIYAGHNEFQSRFEWSRTLRPVEAPAELVGGLFARVNRYSPLCQMIQEVIHTNRLDAPPHFVPRQLIDWPMCSAREYAEILADFERRLQAIVAYCEQLGTLPVLVIPPANDGGFEPSRSALPDSVSRSERERLVRDFQAARAAECEPARALRLYQALVERAPGFAEAHFRVARLLESNGSYDAAARHYELARDADALPIRCPTPFQDAYRNVASKHDAILVDGPAVLRALSAHAILNDALFHDAHHPTLRAYVALAEAVLHALQVRRAFGSLAGSQVPIDPAECAQHFGMNATRWWTVCERSGEFYRWVSITRYDPRERLEKADRYALAARQVAAGVAPERTGVPGLGAGPDP
jgi:tetratricopeptide (TPR) repeat protein